MMGMYKLLALLFVLPCFCGSAMASKKLDLSLTKGAGSTGWTNAKSQSCSFNAGDFIRAGALGLNASPGTHSDEGAIVAIIADRINANGGYFCPWQIQCANKRKYTTSPTSYYTPNGVSSANCMWLCKDGFSGANCGELTVAYDSDTRTLDTVFGAPGVKTDGGSNGNLSANVQVFTKFWRNDFRGVNGADGKKENDKGEVNNVLGVVKLLDHGVMAAPVQVACQWQNWKDVTSFVGTVASCSDPVLLCQEGYTPNSNKTDCVPVTEDMLQTKGKTFCPGFDREKFRSAEHVLDTSGSDCAKYFCKDAGMAFTSATDHTCAECSTGVKGGSNPKDGTCVKCSTGQYFEAKTGECESAGAYSNLDLVYGKGKDRNTQKDLDKQCWTILSPANYKSCVETGGEQVTTSEGEATTIDAILLRQ